MYVSVVVPCYRSAQTLDTLVSEIHSVLSHEVEGYEVLLVVDGSPDDTYLVARRLAESPQVRAILLQRNYGQHNALLAGIKMASFEVVVTMDDDLQHLPDQIPKLLETLGADVDLVYGVAVTEEHHVLRSFASRTVKHGLSLAGVPNASDVSAFRAFRTNLRRGFRQVADPYTNLDVLLSWTTTRVQRVPVQMAFRQEGRSNYSLNALVRHAFNMVTGYSTTPLRIVTFLGLACGALGLILLGIVLWMYVRGTTTVAGFTTVASMLALFSGAQMVSLGIIGEYLGRLHFRSMQHPAYMVREDSTSGAAPPPS